MQPTQPNPFTNFLPSSQAIADWIDSSAPIAVAGLTWGGTYILVKGIQHGATMSTPLGAIFLIKGLTRGLRAAQTPDGLNWITVAKSAPFLLALMAHSAYSV